MNPKIFLACAHFRARAGRIFCLLGQILMIFQFSQRYELCRAPRAHVRARQIFLKECKLCQKISMQFFWFVHSSKSEDFRAIWSLVIFLKILFFFSKKFQNLKIFNFFEEKNFFHEKSRISNVSTATSSRTLNTFRVSRKFKILWRIRWQNTFGATALSRARR